MEKKPQQSAPPQPPQEVKAKAETRVPTEQEMVRMRFVDQNTLP